MPQLEVLKRQKSVFTTLPTWSDANVRRDGSGSAVANHEGGILQLCPLPSFVDVPPYLFLARFGDVVDGLYSVRYRGGRRPAALERRGGGGSAASSHQETSPGEASVSSPKTTTTPVSSEKRGDSSSSSSSSSKETASSPADASVSSSKTSVRQQFWAAHPQNAYEEGVSFCDVMLMAPSQDAPSQTLEGCSLVAVFSPLSFLLW